jgi:hypothetical protein
MSLRQVNGGSWKAWFDEFTAALYFFRPAALRGANPAVNNLRARVCRRLHSATISAARERQDENDAKANLSGIEAD